MPLAKPVSNSVVEAALEHLAEARRLAEQVQ
jgi:hypothetical protein